MVWTGWLPADSGLTVVIYSFDWLVMDGSGLTVVLYIHVSLAMDWLVMDGSGLTVVLYIYMLVWTGWLWMAVVLPWCCCLCRYWRHAD